MSWVIPLSARWYHLSWCDLTFYVPFLDWLANNRTPTIVSISEGLFYSLHREFTLEDPDPLVICQLRWVTLSSWLYLFPMNQTSCPLYQHPKATQREKRCLLPGIMCVCVCACRGWLGCHFSVAIHFVFWSRVFHCSRHQGQKQCNSSNPPKSQLGETQWVIGLTNKGVGGGNLQDHRWPKGSCIMGKPIRYGRWHTKATSLELTTQFSVISSKESLFPSNCCCFV